MYIKCLVQCLAQNKDSGNDNYQQTEHLYSCCCYILRYLWYLNPGIRMFEKLIRKLLGEPRIRAQILGCWIFCSGRMKPCQSSLPRTWYLMSWVIRCHSRHLRKYKYMQNTPKQLFLEASKVNNGEWMEGMLERITENKVEIQMCTITYWVK